MPPPRLSARRTVLVAGLAAIVTGEWTVTRRSERFLEYARQCRAKAAILTGPDADEAALREFYLELARKYERAAWRPWLRVRPGAPLPRGSPLRQ